MTQKLSKGERRRKEILDALKTNGECSVADIMERFACSEATARRDLALLANTGTIIRTLGGAYFERHGDHEIPFRDKQGVLLEEKAAIAAKAASLVQDGEVVGLTGGTTTYLIAKQLKSRFNLTVFTNAVNIAMELADADHVQTVLTGGVIRSKSYELCGPLAESIVGQVNIGTMFVGLDGLTLEHGLTTHSELEAQIGKLMIRRAGRVVAVFDHTKVNKASLFTMCPVSSMHGCVTDRPLGAELEAALREKGIAVYYP